MQWRREFVLLPLQKFCDIDPDDPANMLVFFAFEWTHEAPQSFRLKIFAPSNIPAMSFTLAMSHCDKSLLNDDAPRNMPLISLTRDTSHFEMSASKNFASENIRLMSVTRETSHAPIDPYGLFKQFPLGDSFRHATTALLSCDRDSGENAAVEASLTVTTIEVLIDRTEKD